jgi:hypothetical protein
MHPYDVIPKTRASWRQAHIAETTIFPPAAPLHARVACGSHDGPSDLWVLWAPGALKARAPRWYVLACLSKVREILIILDDPPIHVMGNSAHTPTISAAFNLTLELHALLL